MVGYRTRYFTSYSIDLGRLRVQAGCVPQRAFENAWSTPSLSKEPVAPLGRALPPSCDIQCSQSLVLHESLLISPTSAPCTHSGLPCYCLERNDAPVFLVL